MPITNPKRVAHRLKFLEEKAEIDAVNQRRGIRPADSQLKIGSTGDRYGWNQSISAELGLRQSPEERQWRQTVLERDNYRCVRCDSTENLEADHIKPRAIYPELKFNADNGQTLCHGCHVKTETYGGKIRRLVSVHVR